MTVATLRIQNGPLAGQTFEVAGELVIGRDEGGVTLEDALVSRRHAVVRALHQTLEVEDLGSTNGTFVDGERLTGTKSVIDGAEIRVGTTVLEVRGVVPVEVTRMRPIGEPEATRIGAQLADPEATRPRAVQPAAAAIPTPSPAPPSERAREPASAPVQPAAPPPPPLAPTPLGAGPAAAALPAGEFSPPAMRRGRGLASRSWVPVALSFGSVILTAIALIVYFAAR